MSAKLAFISFFCYETVVYSLSLPLSLLTHYVFVLQPRFLLVSRPSHYPRNSPSCRETLVWFSLVCEWMLVWFSLADLVGCYPERCIPWLGFFLESFVFVFFLFGILDSICLCSLEYLPFNRKSGDESPLFLKYLFDTGYVQDAINKISTRFRLTTCLDNRKWFVFTDHCNVI